MEQAKTVCEVFCYFRDEEQNEKFLCGQNYSFILWISGKYSALKLLVHHEQKSFVLSRSKANYCLFMYLHQFSDCSSGEHCERSVSCRRHDRWNRNWANWLLTGLLICWSFFFGSREGKIKKHHHGMMSFIPILCNYQYSGIEVSFKLFFF